LFEGLAGLDFRRENDGTFGTAEEEDEEAEEEKDEDEDEDQRSGMLFPISGRNEVAGRTERGDVVGR
jgi:hypothetical protein